MLIKGIRNKIKAESNALKTATFTRNLIHFLHMFAVMGVIIPTLIGIDYFIAPVISEQTVTEKYYVPAYGVKSYYIYTNNQNFVADANFFENTAVGDTINFHNTPIFNTTTIVTRINNSNVYICGLNSIYGWPIFVVFVTFVLSTNIVFKTRYLISKRLMNKQKNIRIDSVANIGIINSLLCLIIIVAVLFSSLL